MRAAGERKVLDVRCKRVACGALNEVYPVAGVFEYAIAGRVHDVDVVTRASSHAVGAVAAVEGVVTVAGRERVPPVQARQHVRPRVADDRVGESTTGPDRG